MYLIFRMSFLLYASEGRNVKNARQDEFIYEIIWFIL